MKTLRLTLLIVLALLYGCEFDTVDGSNGGTSNAGFYAATGAALKKDPQYLGDAEKGRHTLLHGDYMTCGIPYKMWQNKLMQEFIALNFGGAAIKDPLPGREGKNANLPYWLNVFNAENGAEVVNANCLLCHGSKFDGELIVGMPNSLADFTVDKLEIYSVPSLLLTLMGLNTAEQDQFNLLFSRIGAMGNATQMRTVGMNPAEMLAVSLMVHHDRDTLEWFDEPLMPIVFKDHDGNLLRPGDETLTSDPPPWWRVKKKNALFYNGMARGDHRGTMELATSVCVNDIERAGEVDKMFQDIQAFINSIEAPKYKRHIDPDLAKLGEGIFNTDCAACHGTYGKTDKEDTYPNLLIPLEIIGTDAAVAEAGVVYGPEMVEWYNQSFYGQVTRMEPSEPFPGYMPPPLDGIWATAPFLHNGSVPTIELVLKSWKRPKYWRRQNLNNSFFDEEALGWPYVSLPYGWDDALILEKKYIYDTTFLSQSNAGHTFGDHLTNDQRRAVIEYLKTL